MAPLQSPNNRRAAIDAINGQTTSTAGAGRLGMLLLLSTVCRHLLYGCWVNGTTARRTDDWSIGIAP